MSQTLRSGKKIHNYVYIIILVGLGRPNIIGGYQAMGY